MKSFPPKGNTHFGLSKKSYFGLNNVPMLPLNHTILIMSMRAAMPKLNALLMKKIGENFELSAHVRL